LKTFTKASNLEFYRDGREITITNWRLHTYGRGLENNAFAWIMLKLIQDRMCICFHKSG